LWCEDWRLPAILVLAASAWLYTQEGRRGDASSAGRDRSPIPNPDASSASAGREPPPGELTTTSRGNRRYELDWLRVIVVLGLIPYHAAVVFAVGPGDYIQNNQRSFVFDAGATLVAFVGMPLLFVISGAATWYALSHRSSSAYLVERVQRLAVPLVFGILALVPIQLYFYYLNQPGYHLSYLQFYGQFLDDWAHIARIGVFGHGFEYWGHLWFLLYLLAVSVFLLPLLVWLHHGPGQRRPTQPNRLTGLHQNGTGISYGTRTVKSWSFTQQHPRWIAPAYRSAKQIMGTEQLTCRSHRWSIR
jgi:hypothetical protein